MSPQVKKGRGVIGAASVFFSLRHLLHFRVFFFLSDYCSESSDEAIFES